MSERFLGYVNAAFDAIFEEHLQRRSKQDSNNISARSSEPISTTDIPQHTENPQQIVTQILKQDPPKNDIENPPAIPLFQLFQSGVTYILIAERKHITTESSVSSRRRIHLADLWRRATKMNFVNEQASDITKKTKPFLLRNLRKSRQYMLGEQGIPDHFHGVPVYIHDPDQFALHPTRESLMKDNETLHRHWEKEYTRAEQVLKKARAIGKTTD